MQHGGSDAVRLSRALDPITKIDQALAEYEQSERDRLAAGVAALDEHYEPLAQEIRRTLSP